MIPDGWEKAVLADNCEILDYKRIPLNQKQRENMKGKFPYWGANGILDYINDFIFDEPLLLFAEDGGFFYDATNKPICHLIDEKCWVNNHAHVIKCFGNALREWMYYWFVHRDITPFINGGTRSKLNQADLRKLPILLPPLAEQKKIAEILTSVDEAIQATQQVIDQTKLVKKGLIQELLTKGIGHTKFKKVNVGYFRIEIPITWEIKKVKDIMTRIRKPVQLIQNKNYTEIGIRSHAKGLFYKTPKKGNKIGNKSVFWVIPNCFIVNIVFAWERAVALTTEKENGMIASHRFPMYSSKKNILNLEYITKFFQSFYGHELLISASPGGAGRNKTLNQKYFLDLDIPLPPLQEQKEIIRILSSIDNAIQENQNKLKQLKTLKKGLMQDLLTGKVRVKV